MEIKTVIKINAKAEQVWQTLINFKDYKKWNPFITSIIGEPKEGNTIKVSLPEMSFSPKIRLVNKNKELRWVGHFMFKGLFDGEHRFKIQDNNDGTITFYHQEKFSGILIPIFRKKLESQTVQGFNAMNKKLKEVVEKKYNSSKIIKLT